MKKIVLLLCFITLSVYSSEQNEQDPQCCNLGSIAYKLASLCIIKDYRTLAFGGHPWLLRKKIELNEDRPHLDSYYMSHIITLVVPGSREITVSIYGTPLHAAVYSGSLDCVKLLRASGADKSKPIKDATTISSEEIAALPGRVFHIVSCIKDEEFESKIQQVKEKEMIGLSAVDVARKRINTTDDYELNKRRKAILALLEKKDE